MIAFVIEKHPSNSFTHQKWVDGLLSVRKVLRTILSKNCCTFYQSGSDKLYRLALAA